MRALPSRVGIYFVLAMALFPGIGYLRVWDKMTAALDDLGLPRPSEKALRDLRRRLGPAPVKAMFETVTVPLAPPGTPGVLPGAAHGGTRRPELGQGARQRPEPVLAGQDDDLPGPGRVPGHADRGRVRCPRLSGQGIQ
jgi:hypothetical protein